jgi:hypothetical protein
LYFFAAGLKDWNVDRDKRDADEKAAKEKTGKVEKAPSA